ncbi:hypothetical protein POWCR01_140026600 [Plasmodium ovale]|uniref:Uncharacterized protein n=1 Tax=Plasmodium ovale TaxID=36330 RepID=A0A1C3L502_PLAOA|nr:hypothetical protein POWCR01_140026600 [Plasmodium ovale]
MSTILVRFEQRESKQVRDRRSQVCITSSISKLMRSLKNKNNIYTGRLRLRDDDDGKIYASKELLSKMKRDNFSLQRRRGGGIERDLSKILIKW